MIRDREKEYALTAFNSLKANMYRWTKDLDSHVERSISRVFYDQVVSTGPVKTKWSTVLSQDWEYNVMCDDHYMAPQTVCKFIMDCPFVLEDFNIFSDIFAACRKTIYITKDQNEELKQLTKKEPVVTRDRYKHLGYTIYVNGDPNNVLEKPELEVPSYYTDWENKTHANGFRPIVVDNNSPNLVGCFG